MDRLSVLIVDPDAAVTAALAAVIPARVSMRTCRTFDAARRLLFDQPPDLLVSNFRLEAHNGLHLVHLAAFERLRTRALLYAAHDDPVLTAEARGAGAFVESLERLIVTLPAYVAGCGTLPPVDRRRGAPRQHATFRGGRRAADRWVNDRMREAAYYSFAINRS